MRTIKLDKEIIDMFDDALDIMSGAEALAKRSVRRTRRIWKAIDKKYPELNLSEKPGNINRETRCLELPFHDAEPDQKTEEEDSK